MKEADYNTLVAGVGVLCGITLFLLISLSIGQLSGLPTITDLFVFGLVPRVAYLIIGWALVLIWLPIFIAGIYTLGHRGVVGMSGHLVNYGIYRYVRNPMYSGILFVILGFAFISNSAAILVAAIIWSAVSVFECEREIKGLEERFGPDYKAYEKSTPLFIPNFFKMICKK